jgi:hypothetical protein
MAQSYLLERPETAAPVLIFAGLKNSNQNLGERINRGPMNIEGSDDQLAETSFYLIGLKK